MTICSFCGKPRGEVAHLHEGSRERICNECVALCMEIFDKHRPSGAPTPEGRHIACSFCGTDERDARCMIAGPTAFICDGCAERFDHTQ